jgi:hypothetical protein
MELKSYFGMGLGGEKSGRAIFGWEGTCWLIACVREGVRKTGCALEGKTRVHGIGGS